MCLALTCTALTAFLDESTKPFVIVPKTPVCVEVEAEGLLAFSSVAGAFGDKRRPIPLVKREKADFPGVPDPEASRDEGCGIFKLFAHADIPEVDITDCPLRAVLSCPVVAVGPPAGGAAVAAAGCLSIPELVSETECTGRELAISGSIEKLSFKLFQTPHRKH